jgi:uncharacterized protein YbjT (DUF2867 family)
MRILIAGASGAIGRPLIRRLRANQHEVFALIRSRDSAPALKDIGAEPVIADAVLRLAGVDAVGQRAATVSKIRRVRAMLDRLRPACELEVGGGIHAETAALEVGAGAHVLVAGSAIFEDPAGVRAGMARLRASVAGAA